MRDKEREREKVHILGIHSVQTIDAQLLALSLHFEAIDV